MRYDEYILTGKEKIIYFMESLLIVTVVAYLFYSTILFILFTPILFIFFMKLKKKELIQKRQDELKLAFKETLRSISANLNAGYSVENAFRESLKDIYRIYGAEHIMSKELYVLVNSLKNNISVEQLIHDLGERSQVAEIKDFGAVFSIAKRSGGDMNTIIRDCSENIREKIEVEREIQTLLNAKKFEQKIMNAVPFAIIAYVRMASPGYFDSLYHNAVGMIIMSVCLLLYVCAYQMAQKIVNITI